MIRKSTWRPGALAEPADHPVLQHAQELHLQRGGVSSISSRKDGAAGGGRELAGVTRAPQPVKAPRA